MKRTERFTVYKHSLVYCGKRLAKKQFIVLAHSDGTLQFTDFHRYIKNPNRKIKKFSDNGNNRFVFVNMFLNYAFFTKGISSLSDLTVDIGKDFLNAYGMHELPDDDEDVTRTEVTIKRCVRSVLDFYINLTADKSACCKIKPENLYKRVPYQNKRGKVCYKNEPVFDVEFIPYVKDPIFRDLPNRAFTLLFDHIVNNHKDILGLVIVQSFAGLRPSEGCNVRREDSPLGAGIRFDRVNGKLKSVTIDLRDELNLRSDHLTVGGIKKERIARVPGIFLSAFEESYKIYMEYMEGRPYEAEYGAFSVNLQGKAITYDSYYTKFHDIIKNEMIDIYLHDYDEEVVRFGMTLMDHSLSPQVFRHWFTVQLVLSGINEPGVLMAFRGDTSPDSSLPYINSKGELEKQYSKISSETFNYSLWAAKKKHDERIKNIYQ